MISNRAIETVNLALAAANTNVAVIKTRTVTDSNGKTHTETYTVYEDRSFTYRALAAAAALNAQADARRANESLARLKPLVDQMRSHPALASERLSVAGHSNQSIEEGGGALVPLLLPPLVSLFSSMSSSRDGRDALKKFAPLLDSITTLENEVLARRSAEQAWLDEKTTAEIRRQTDSVPYNERLEAEKPGF
jgi:hypothetical protein